VLLGRVVPLPLAKQPDVGPRDRRSALFLDRRGSLFVAVGAPPCRVDRREQAFKPLSERRRSRLGPDEAPPRTRSVNFR
jgi:hypothetical protein